MTNRRENREARKRVILAWLIGNTILLLAVAGAACQQAPDANTNANTSAANANAVANVQPSPTPRPSPVVETREPDSYRATLVLKAETTGGNRGVALPTLSAEVARAGSDRRVSFRLPNGGQVVYLNRGGTRYVVLPDRRQYAELSPEAVGFEMPRLMMPDQIVDYLQKQRGYERVGEDQVNGRAVVKYVASGTTRTGTQAGDVNAQAFVYVDKETGLPLRTEMLADATGNVQGVSGLKVITEMRDIRTDVDPSLFEVPQGMNKVTAEEVRRQVDTVMSAATAIAGALLNNMAASSRGASPTPAVSPSPTQR